MTDGLFLSWSGGKDCLMALDELRHAGERVVRGLVTSVARDPDGEARVPVHGVRLELIERQADALGVPLHTVEIPVGARNAEYEAAWLSALDALRAGCAAPPTLAFGDIFLEDVRTYRERLLARADWRSLFPLWGRDTSSLAREFIGRGHKAITTSVSAERLDASFVGQEFTLDFLARLPPDADPCGERGEFHTFVFDSPLFREPVRFVLGRTGDDGRHHTREVVPL